MTLNNNQVADILRNAYAQSIGKDTYVNSVDIIGSGSKEAPQYPAGSEVPISTLDLTDFVDEGNTSEILKSQEQFTKGLVNTMIKRWYTDEKYRSEDTNLYFTDSREFGAITSIVSVEVPGVEENTAWKNFTDGTTVGVYEIRLPIVSESFYGKSVSYKLPITLTGEQWNTAFKSVEELGEFVNYIFLIIDNKLSQHKEDCDNMCRNNYIASKILGEATGVQTLNLVEEYCIENGLTKMTVQEYMNNPDALRHGMGLMNEYSKYLRKQSTLFNTEGKTKFIPQERFTFELLNKFRIACEREVLTDSFNTQYAELKDRYHVVPYWQGFVDGTHDALTFDALSSINIKTEKGTVTHSGIVGLMVDKYAIMHTIISQRVAFQHFDMENVNMYEYQYVSRFANNLSLNGLVYLVEDFGA